MRQANKTYRHRLVRFAAYSWALPASLMGAVFVLLTLMTGGQAKRHTGVWEAWGGWPGRCLARGLPFSGSVAAITFGHVVLATCSDSIQATRKHEREHVRQYEHWGLLFFPAYLLAGMLAWLKGGNPYRDNVFEIAARKAEFIDRSDA